MKNRILSIGLLLVLTLLMVICGFLILSESPKADDEANILAVLLLISGAILFLVGLMFQLGNPQRGSADAKTSFVGYLLASMCGGVTLPQGIFFEPHLVAAGSCVLCLVSFLAVFILVTPTHGHR